jgi:hypothetical protein
MRSRAIRVQRLLGLLVALLARGLASASGEIAVTRLEHYTENRSWNEAGLGPTHQVIVSAMVAPSGLPTLVFAEKDGVRQPLAHFPQPGNPDVYALWQRVDAAAGGAWSVRAERGDARSAPVTTRVLAKPQKVPLVRNLRVKGPGAEPRLRWNLPNLDGFDIERIRVGVRGGPRVHGRFMSLLYVSGGLPPDARAFRIPPGVLGPGERYVFQVMLEDLEGAELENRSLTFSEPYTVLR